MSESVLEIINDIKILEKDEFAFPEDSFISVK